MLNAQIMKTFDCGLFSLDYPASFRSIPIQNAPHMVLKIESNDYTASASYWDYDLNSTVSVWDDDIVEHYRNFPMVNGGDLVNITKKLITTKSGSQKCLKIKYNIKAAPNASLKMLQYLFINKGFLFVFSFMSQGKYAHDTPTSYPDKIISGLKFK